MTTTAKAATYNVALYIGAVVLGFLLSLAYVFTR